MFEDIIGPDKDNIKVKILNKMKLKNLERVSLEEQNEILI